MQVCCVIQIDSLNLYSLRRNLQGRCEELQVKFRLGKGWNLDLAERASLGHPLIQRTRLFSGLGTNVKL